jgi:hypothetical protein
MEELRMVIGKEEPQSATGTDLKRAIAIGLDECVTALDEALHGLTDEQLWAFPIGSRHNIVTLTEHCLQCRGPLTEHWSPGCKFLCDDLPCDKLQTFASDGYEHPRLAVENLKQMKASGLEAWIAKQPRVMFCPGWRF